MADDFLNEIISVTRAAISNSSVYIHCGSIHLRDSDLTLYGESAGDDYARTTIDDIKAGIKQSAQSRKMSVTIRVPAGGSLARKQMEETYKSLLKGFEISVCRGSLSINWKSHFNL